MRSEGWAHWYFRQGTSGMTESIDHSHPSIDDENFSAAQHECVSVVAASHSARQQVVLVIARLSRTNCRSRPSGSFVEPGSSS